MSKIPFRKLPLEERRRYKAQKERERYARLHPGTNLEQNPLEKDLKGEISKLSEVIAQQSAEINLLKERTRERSTIQSIENIDSCCKNIDLCLKQYSTLKHSLCIESTPQGEPTKCSPCMDTNSSRNRDSSMGKTVRRKEFTLKEIFSSRYPDKGKMDCRFIAPRLSELNSFATAGFDNTDMGSDLCQISWKDHFWPVFRERGHEDLAFLTEREALDIALESVARALSDGIHLGVGEIIRRNPKETLPTLLPEERLVICQPCKSL